MCIIIAVSSTDSLRQRMDSTNRPTDFIAAIITTVAATSITATTTTTTITTTTTPTVHRSRVDPRKECESCGNARFRKRKYCCEISSSHGGEYDVQSCPDDGGSTHL
jgi:hypothetical protein